MNMLRLLLIVLTLLKELFPSLKEVVMSKVYVVLNIDLRYLKRFIIKRDTFFSIQRIKSFLYIICINITFYSNNIFEQWGRQN